MVTKRDDTLKIIIKTDSFKISEISSIVHLSGQQSFKSEKDFEIQRM